MTWNIHYMGIVSIVFFYLIILAVGIWAGKKAKGSTDSEEVMLAGRNIGMLVGVFTMTATWVGGAYINGTAEAIFASDLGFVWCQAPFGYALSLILGGFFFANKMRTEGYVTMLDPFQRKYGERMGGLLYLPALMGEVFWSAAVLAALGSTLAVIIDMDNSTAIVLSTCIAIAYTLFGGLYAVAYTDVAQLFCIFIGLWLAVPFALNHRAMEGRSIMTKPIKWMGTVEKRAVGSWFDSAFLLVLGGIPWQVYFQRVLSAKSPGRAQIMSYAAALGCVILAIPAFLIGAIAKTANWNETLLMEEKNITINEDVHRKMILPMVLQYLCPSWVTFIGLGAVSAAVMSSADSSVLSASSMFARNIYKCIFRQKASEIEILWVMRIGIFGVGLMAMIMGILIKSIYELWFLCGDMVYVILFPQLVSVIYLEGSNTYGSLAGFLYGVTLRLLGGENAFKITALIHYPGYDPVTNIQYFPFKSLTMATTFVVIIGVSYPLKYLFENKILPKHWDLFQCIVNIPDERVVLKEPEVPNGEVSAINAKRSGLGANGSINPALKLTRDDLLLSANYQRLAESRSPSPCPDSRIPGDWSSAETNLQNDAGDGVNGGGISDGNNGGRDGGGSGDGEESKAGVNSGGGVGSVDKGVSRRSGHGGSKDGSMSGGGSRDGDRMSGGGSMEAGDNTNPTNTPFVPTETTITITPDEA